MCSAAVHPELPPRGGAASAVEEKQRVCRELPDQGIRPESAIPREPPAKPRWAGVLSPTEPCSPKLSVPCVRGNPSTASSSSLSRSSLASSALAEQFWNGPWIALEKVQHLRHPPGRLRELEHHGSLLPGVSPVQPSRVRLQHTPDPSTKSKDCLPPCNNGQKSGLRLLRAHLRRRQATSTSLHVAVVCGPLGLSLASSGNVSPCPLPPLPRGQHPHLPPASWSPRLPTTSATLSQSLTPTVSSPVTAAVTRPQLSSCPHTHPLTPATAPQPPGTPSSDPAPFHSPSPSHAPTSLLPAETPGPLL
ncbi:mucin-2-like isoform X2 [Physeter macrocephalus]|nr:mucin-2-like isoform X2 [Physeter catodon]XP_028352224.1 mucin-2-like isoform X2 [Physeter catodon]|eukprot:XP_028352223.1 mucin-2-like isoform X2 [Physeter catodon]